MSMYGEKLEKDEKDKDSSGYLLDYAPFDEDYEMEEKERKFLSVEETLSIALANERINVATLQAENLELKIQLLQAKKDQMDPIITSLRGDRRKLLIGIHTKYDIPLDKKWEYNPETREIVINE